MKFSKWNILLISVLSATSIGVYIAQIHIFDRIEETFFYLFQDLAFMPLQILLVTVIINELLSKREKRSILNKMNMVVGAYFSEVGNHLLNSLSKFDNKMDKINTLFTPETQWTKKFVLKFNKVIKEYNYELDIHKGDLIELRDFLNSKRAFIVGLLQNSKLLEHESFTDLLWAVTHLAEELDSRKDLEELPEKDAEHLTGDIKRAYMHSITEWICYMKHLKGEYPFIFSLYLRTNPFDPNARVEVK